MRPAWARLLTAVVGVVGCSGRTIVLGESSPPPLHFQPPELVAELASPFSTDNPTLTADQREIFFTSDRVSGNSDVWFATRGTTSAPFEPPQPLNVVNTAAFETSSAISGDGLTLWFGSDRLGGAGAIDIWVTHRAARDQPWSTPVNVVALSSPADDIPRPPGEHGLVMPLASTRPAAANPSSAYQTYFARRSAVGTPFAEPVPIPELDFATRSTVDAFLTDDGLSILFSSAPMPVDAGAAPTPGAAELYVAWRRSTGEPFSVTQPLDDLNTAGDERDPWLAPDGRTLYFTSDRAGVLQIYRTRLRAR